MNRIALLTIVLFFLTINSLKSQSTNSDFQFPIDTAGLGLELQYVLDKGLPPSGYNFDRAGEQVVVLGDINGDGYDDWAIGKGNSADYQSSQSSGAVFIYLGSNSRRQSETPADMIIRGGFREYYGDILNGAGDVNNDGYDDFLVRKIIVNEDYTLTERVWDLFYGGDPFDPQPDVHFRKRSRAKGTVSTCLPAGDVNKDGYDDILMSIPTQTGSVDTGFVYLYLGGEMMDTVPDRIYKGKVYPTKSSTGAGGASNFNGAVGAGDMNNDGYDDVIISSHEGAMFYFSGPDADNVEDLLFNNLPATGLGTGPQLTPLGDVNNDGYDDVLIRGYVANTIAFVFLGGETVDIDPDVTIPMWTELKYYEFSASALGDYNNDGYDDLILGTSTLWPIPQGEARIFFGGSEMDSIADIQIPGPVPGNVFGFSVAGNGDFDGDGNGDFLVGDIGNAGTIDRHDEDGSVSLYYGNGQADVEAGAVFTGDASREGFGAAVVIPGDVNNDGYFDLLVGSPNYWSNPYYVGRTYLYLGGEEVNTKADFIFQSEQSPGRHFFGMKLYRIGDVNGDQYDDICIEENGRISVYYGGEEMDTIADQYIDIPQYNYSFAPLGDVNGDGKDDVLYGESQTGGGNAWLYLGKDELFSTADVSISGSVDGQLLGTTCSGAGDLNNDGLMDFVISSPGHTGSGLNEGQVHVFYGKENPNTEPDLVIQGLYEDHHLGSGILRGNADINADGYHDLVVADRLYSESSSSYEGRIYIYYGGENMDNLPDESLTGTEPGYQLGRSLCLIEDLNNDGADEILVNNGNYLSGSETTAMYFGGDPLDETIDVNFNFTLIHNSVDSYTDLSDTSAYFLIGDQSDQGHGIDAGRLYAFSNMRISIDTTSVDTTTIDTTTIDTTGSFIITATLKNNSRNYPNPFTEYTVLEFYLEEESPVEINIYDLYGRKMETLFKAYCHAGFNTVTYRPESKGNAILIYKIQTNRSSMEGRMLMRK